MVCDENYHFLKDSDVCVNYCPTGYFSKKFSTSCLGEGQLVIDLEFKFENQSTIDRNWSNYASYTDTKTKELISWNTLVFGGLNEASIDMDDPLLMQ
jgi:hypothetical protein